MLRLIFLLFFTYSFSSHAQVKGTVNQYGKYGLKTKSGEVVLKNENDSITAFFSPWDNYFVVGNKGEFEFKIYEPNSKTTTHVVPEKFTHYKAVNSLTEGTTLLMIDSLGVNRIFDFDTKTVRVDKVIVSPAVNTSGKYGLYKDGKPILAYQFSYLRKAQATDDIIAGSNQFEFFEATTDSGFLYFDKTGKLLFPVAVERISTFYMHPNVYCVSKEQKVGYFSIDNSYFSPLLAYADIEKAFDTRSSVVIKNLDQPSVIHAETGDIIVDAKQNKLLEESYEKTFLAKKATIAIVKKNQSWLFIDIKSGNVENEQVFDTWIGEITVNKKPLGFYIKDNAVKALNLKKYKEVDEFLFTGLRAHKTSDGDYILFNNAGQIVTPRMTYTSLSIERFNKKLVYIAKTLEGKAGVLDNEAQTLVPFEYDDIESVYLWSSVNYFIVSKDNKKGLAKAVDEAPYLQMISAFEYTQLEVEMIGDFVLVGQKSDGSREIVKTNGKIVKL